MTFLFVASQFWREMCPAATNQADSYASHFAGFLPTVDRSSATNLPVGARPRLVLHSEENIWHTISLLIPVFVQGTCTPLVHAHVGRTGARGFAGAPESGSKVAGRNPVTFFVMSKQVCR